jgi:hypothetical protein
MLFDKSGKLEMSKGELLLRGGATYQDDMKFNIMRGDSEEDDDEANEDEEFKEGDNADEDDGSCSMLGESDREDAEGAGQAKKGYSQAGSNTSKDNGGGNGGGAAANKRRKIE